MFPFNYIHNHLVRRGTHSSLGVDMLAPLHRRCEEDSPILFTVAVWGVRVYFSPLVSLNQVQDLIYNYENYEITIQISLQHFPVSCVFCLKELC